VLSYFDGALQSITEHLGLVARVKGRCAIQHLVDYGSL
jgi:hypothetical protein